MNTYIKRYALHWWTGFLCIYTGVELWLYPNKFDIKTLHLLANIFVVVIGILFLASPICKLLANNKHVISYFERHPRLLKGVEE